MNEVHKKGLKYLIGNIGVIKPEIFDIKNKQKDIKFRFKRYIEQYKIKQLLNNIGQNSEKNEI